MNAPPAPTLPVVPILILNYDGWNDTFAGLELMSGYLDNLWVIDNGSRVDRTAELAARFPHVRLIQLDDNHGWAGGYNRALQVVAEEGHPYAYLLNNDAVLSPESIPSIIRAFRSSQKVAAVGSIVRKYDGTVLFDGEMYNFRSAAERNAKDFDQGTRPARTLHGAGVAISLDAFRAHGPFHEEYFLYCEETDWLVRARQRGWTLLVDGTSIVTHKDQGSDSNSNARYYRARNRFPRAAPRCLDQRPERDHLVTPGSTASRHRRRSGVSPGGTRRPARRHHRPLRQASCALACLGPPARHHYAPTDLHALPDHPPLRWAPRATAVFLMRYSTCRSLDSQCQRHKAPKPEHLACHRALSPSRHDACAGREIRYDSGLPSDVRFSHRDR